MTTSPSMDPLHGHCLCEHHMRMFKPRRIGLQWYFIPQDELPIQMLCGRCTPEKRVRGALVFSDQSLRSGIVTFLKNAAFDIMDLRQHAKTLEGRDQAVS